MTVGDVLARVGANSSGRGVGLRGGIFHLTADSSAVHVDLNEVRWTEDLAVSGKIDKPLARTGSVRASLELFDGVDASASSTSNGRKAWRAPGRLFAAPSMAPRCSRGRRRPDLLSRRAAYFAGVT